MKTHSTQIRRPFRRPENSEPFTYRKSDEAEKAADLIEEFIILMNDKDDTAPTGENKTLFEHEEKVILLQSLSRIVRHALFARHNVDVSGVTDDREAAIINTLLTRMESATFAG